jgi:NADH-quinone oxidoreductase subunit F
MHSKNIKEMLSAHTTLCEFNFDIPKIKQGYANRTLRIDLSKNEITIQPVTQQMKDLWIGGKGFDLWLMNQEIKRNTKWTDSENPICFASGPLGGTTSFPGSGKTIVTSISPLTKRVIDSNVGGYFGPYFKFAGFDAMTIVGKAKEEIVILIDAAEQKITIETAPKESIDSHILAEELTEMYASDEIDMKNIAVVSAGRAADHTLMGLLNFSFYDWRRGVARLKQAGRGGIGTVFRDKKIKALIVKNKNISPAWRVEENKVAKEMTPSVISVQSCPSEKAEIKAIVTNYDSNPEFIIEMMQELQDKYRHISKTAIDILNEKTKVAKSEIYHIATFYKSFSLEQKGETIVQVCTGTACHVKGAMNILNSFERVLGIKEGETSKDKKYSLEGVRCVGACSIAPVVKIGEQILGNVNAKDVEKIVANCNENSGITTNTAAVTCEASGNCNCSKVEKGGLDKIKQEETDRTNKYKAMLMVCTGTGCISANGMILKNELEALITKKNLSDDFVVVGTGCNGFCAVGPILVVQPEGIFYQKVQVKDLEEIIESHLKGGQIVERLLHKDPISSELNKTIDDIKFFTKQQLIALKNKGLIDPEDIKQYIARDGYKALEKALSMDSDTIITDVIASGLRGRGGGGFPAGVKWKSCLKAKEEKDEVAYIVCNADEGDPGAFMDRSIIETDPHAVIEGMIIGAKAIGATDGYIYIRKEYPLALERLGIAIKQAESHGLLGNNIMGTDFSFKIHVHRGAGAFVCGESSALMASMAGKAGEPRAKYVHNVEFGFRDKPTVLNNVETWANIPSIIDKGSKWFASIGSGDVSENPWNGSSGTKVFSLVGNVNNTGLVEVPMGITLGEIVEEIGGGIPDGRTLKAVQTGGPSGGCIPADKLDMQVDFDSLTKAGSMMGSGGMIVMDDKTCMVDVARYFIDFLVDESCGKCTPCREGLFALKNTLQRICNGKGKESDIDFLIEISETIAETSLCQLGGSAPNPVLSTIKYFRDEYEEHIHKKLCRAGVCTELITYSITDACKNCKVCVKACPVDAISREDKIHKIDTAKCIKCGICLETCKFDSVEVK